jgi:hypothetical protein
LVGGVHRLRHPTEKSVGSSAVGRATSETSIKIEVPTCTSTTSHGEPWTKRSSQTYVLLPEPRTCAFHIAIIFPTHCVDRHFSHIMQHLSLSYDYIRHSYPDFPYLHHTRQRCQLAINARSLTSCSITNRQRPQQRPQQTPYRSISRLPLHAVARIKTNFHVWSLHDAVRTNRMSPFPDRDVQDLSASLAPPPTIWLSFFIYLRCVFPASASRLEVRTKAYWPKRRCSSKLF